MIVNNTNATNEMVCLILVNFTLMYKDNKYFIYQKANKNNHIEFD